MINELKLFHLPAGVPVELIPAQDFFYLSTCQRVIILGLSNIPHQYLDKYDPELEVFAGGRAYKFLLETICGLKSKITGENEIVSQFKTAFAEYLAKKDRNPKLIRILEKLFQDSKKVRTQHLFNVGQQSYAGITRRLLEANDAKQEVLLVGNGTLSQSLVKVLKKRFDLYVTGRNQEKVEKFGQINGPKPINWLNLHQWANFPLIVNTIGADEIIFDNLFFDLWIDKYPENNSRQFIDLGCPSVLNTSYGLEHGVARLKDVFDKGDTLDREKEAKIISARVAIEEITGLRAITFAQRISTGLGEQRFA